MNLRQLKKDYEDLSNAASEVGRKLAFAGIALVWIFKTEAEGAYRIPADLYWPTALIMSSLAADFLQYVLATTILYACFRRLEGDTSVSASTDFQLSIWANRPAWTLWLVKLVLVAAAWLLLLLYVVKELGQGQGG